VPRSFEHAEDDDIARRNAGKNGIDIDIDIVMN